MSKFLQLLVILLFSLNIQNAYAEKCYMAEDFGLGGTFRIPANPDENSPAGTTQLLKDKPLNRQIAPWVSTGLSTVGVSNDPAAKSSPNILKIYVDGQWSPWGGDLSTLKPCVIRDCDNSVNLEKICLENGKIVEYIDPDLIPCSLGNSPSGSTNADNSEVYGWGLYGLIALADKDGKSSDPNDPAYFENLPPSLFRTFRMSPLQQDGKSYFFSIDTTETCELIDGKTICTKDTDNEAKKNNIIGKGDLYFKIMDRYYPDNVGSYNVNIVRGVYTPKGFIETTIDAIEDQLSIVTYNLYKAITEDYAFVKVIKLLLILYMIFIGLGFMFGTLKIHQGELLVRGIKIAIVMIVISDNSWEFFNKYLFSIFTTGARSIADIIVNSTVFYESSADSARFILPSDSTALSVFDAILKMIISGSVNCKILSLCFSFYILYIPIFYICMYYLLLAIIRCVVLYIVAIILIAMMLVISPIFISFLLFKFTKEFFDIWLKQLMASAMQLIVVSATIALMISLINDQLSQLLFYQICYKVVWTFGIGEWVWFQIWWWTPTDFQQVESCLTPVNFFSFLIICILFNAFMDEIPGMIDILSGAFLQPIKQFYDGMNDAFFKSRAYQSVTGIANSARGLTLGRAFNKETKSEKYESVLGIAADLGRRANANISRIGSALGGKDE